jgi:hypothetical protein
MDLETELLGRFEPECIEPRFGPMFLHAFCKKSATVTGEDWLRYRLETDIRLNGSNYGLRFKEKYFDATYNLCLTWDGALVATLGFEVDGAAMNIWQIQGVKGRAEPLRAIKWERALVEYAVAWSRGMGLQEVFIVSVSHHEWASTHGHLDPSRGYMRYDVTARRCGFAATGDGYFRRVLRDSLTTS